VFSKLSSCCFDGRCFEEKKKGKAAEKKKAPGKAKLSDSGTRPAVESADASLAGFDAKRAGILKLLSEGS
jgi:hypothetical protein